MKINLRIAVLATILLAGLGAVVMTYTWELLPAPLLAALGLIEARDNSSGSTKPTPEADPPEPQTDIAEIIDETDKNVEELSKDELQEQVNDAMEDL